MKLTLHSYLELRPRYMELRFSEFHSIPLRSVLKALMYGTSLCQSRCVYMCYDSIDFFFELIHAILVVFFFRNCFHITF